MVDDHLPASMNADIDTQRILEQGNRMRSGLVAEVTIYRRSIVAFVLVFVCFLNGCATHYSSGSLSILPTKRILFIAPRYDPSLNLKISAWAALISADELRDEQLRINAALSPWDEKVVGKFSSTLIDALQEKGYSIDKASSEDRTSISRKSAADVEIRSYLTAGFVYKTLTSPTYVPFVMVVL